MHQGNMAKRSEFSRSLSKDFFENKADTTIMKAIDDKKPILKQNGGISDEYDLDDYLAYFESVKNYLDAGSLNLRDVYSDYAHYIERAYNDTEVINYIHTLRKVNTDPAYYVNFEKLAHQMFEIDKQLKK